VRFRRDFAYCSLIRAHAVLLQANRDKDANDRIAATVDDYAVVRELGFSGAVHACSVSDRNDSGTEIDGSQILLHLFRLGRAVQKAQSLTVAAFDANVPLT